eukprot:COSAG04_NODE_11469_length_707_cov_1.324013_2_plen_95_part_00
MPGADYHRGILAWLPEIWSMQQEAGVEGGEFDDENDINKSYHDLCVENGLSTEHGAIFLRSSQFQALPCRRPFCAAIFSLRHSATVDASHHHSF